MVQCKWKNLILDTATNKAVTAYKRWNIVVEQKLNAIVDEAINTQKKQDAIAKASMLIKN